MFDTQSFLDSKISKELSTQVKPVPAGEYKGVIEPLTDDCVSEFQGKDGTTYHKLRIFWDISNPELMAELKRKSVRVNQDIFLDVIMGANGKPMLDPDNNVGLGRLREALGQNTAKDWTIRQLPGCAATVTVTHRIDPKSGGTFAEVSRVGKL